MLGECRKPRPQEDGYKISMTGMDLE